MIKGYEVLGPLDEATFDMAAGIAELPDTVRGYEDLKVQRVAEFR